MQKIKCETSLEGDNFSECVEEGCSKNYKKNFNLLIWLTLP